MPIAIDLTGFEVNQLKVLRRADDGVSSPVVRWVCACKCGKEVTYRSDRIRAKTVRDCGCGKAKRPPGINPVVGPSAVQLFCDKERARLDADFIERVNERCRR